MFMITCNSASFARHTARYDRQFIVRLLNQSSSEKSRLTKLKNL